MLALAAAALLLAAGCTDAPAATTTTTPPATTTQATTTTTTEPPPRVIPAAGPAPVGVDPESACMQRAVFGDPADSLYVLPFAAGERYRVSQAYCREIGGHRLQLAYDFDMPVGAEVLAARAGIVVDQRDDSPDDGVGVGEHNYLMIRHDDGTVAFYAHLMQDGLVATLGDHVEQGQVIAYSGNSGATSGPHLHFGVYRSWPPSEGYDVPVVFRNASGPFDLLGGLATDGVVEALPPGVEPARGPRPPSDYHGQALAGLALPGAVLWGYDFSGADLTGADLHGADLIWADFTGATLAGADLSTAVLEHARLEDADLRGADLSHAVLSEADLRGAVLVGADLSGIWATFPDLRGADLTGATLTDARFIAAEWDDATTWPEGYDPPPMP